MIRPRLGRTPAPLAIHAAQNRRCPTENENGSGSPYCFNAGEEGL
ncbi:hypothetical protein [Neobacillus niacini]|nr:hypothetical protein [Neobacillus niacini]